MADDNKTVFISYRRNVSSYIARAIFQDLRKRRYDVFMDVETIDSGQFDTIILNQIAARAHFLVILTPGTVERCEEPGDWLRREIEHAMDLQRNIVPILTNDFTFKGTDNYLTGKLKELSRYNACKLYHEYFDAGMEALRNRFLKQPVYGVVIPAPPKEQAAAQERIAEAARQPTPTEKQLSAEDFFNRAMARNSNSDEEIADYSEAIRLNPQYADAYSNRGIIYAHKREFDASIIDYSEAIRLDPQNILAYINRGLAHKAKGDLKNAIDDYSEVIRFSPEAAMAYFHRGQALETNKDFKSAIVDFTKVIRLAPEYVKAYQSRGMLLYVNGDIDAAMDDFKEAIRLDSNYPYPYWGLGYCYDKVKLYGQALDCYERFLQLVRGEPNSWLIKRVSELKKQLGRP
jgi:tetratricopeptide (TPR) repeat protein